VPLKHWNFPGIRVKYAKVQTPPEIVAHLPPLCEEKNIPYIFVKNQKELGAACGLKVGCSSAVILETGKAKDLIDDVINKTQALK
jgi:large subunit ribosomal protein L7Ae